jgi:methylglutaconyl-CoA hydratase
VHEVLSDEPALHARVEAVVAELLSAGPLAARAAKAVIREQRELPREAALRMTVQWAARQRVSPEGQQGLGAFLEKRPPGWRG